MVARAETRSSSGSTSEVAGAVERVDVPREGVPILLEGCGVPRHLREPFGEHGAEFAIGAVDDDLLSLVQAGEECSDEARRNPGRK